MTAATLSLVLVVVISSISGATSVDAIDAEASEREFRADVANLSVVAQRIANGAQVWQDFVHFQEKMKLVVARVENWTILRKESVPDSAPVFDAEHLEELSQRFAKPKVLFETFDGTCIECPIIALSPTATDALIHHRWVAFGFLDFLTNWFSDKGYRLAAQIADSLRANCSSEDLVKTFGESFSDSVVVSAVNTPGTCDACGILYNDKTYTKLLNCFLTAGQLRMLAQAVCAMVNDLIPNNAYAVNAVNETENKLRQASEKMRSNCANAASSTLPYVWKTPAPTHGTLPPPHGTMDEIVAEIGVYGNVSNLDASDVLLALSNRFPDTEFYVHKTFSSGTRQSCLSFDRNATGFAGSTWKSSREAGFSEITKSPVKLTVLWHRPQAPNLAVSCISAVGMDESKLYNCSVGQLSRSLSSKDCETAVADLIRCASRECEGKTPSFGQIVCDNAESYAADIAWNMNDLRQENWKKDATAAKDCIGIVGFLGDEKRLAEEEGLVYYDYVEYKKAVDAYFVWEKLWQQNCSGAGYCMQSHITPIFGPILHPLSLVGVYAPFIAKPLESLGMRSGIANVIRTVKMLDGAVTGNDKRDLAVDTATARVSGDLRKSLEETKAFIKVVLLQMDGFIVPAMAYLRKRYTASKQDLANELQKVDASKRGIYTKVCQDRKLPTQLLDELYQALNQSSTKELLPREFSALQRLLQYVVMILGQSNEVCSAAVGLSALQALQKRNEVLNSMHEFHTLFVQMNREHQRKWTWG